MSTESDKILKALVDAELRSWRSKGGKSKSKAKQNAARNNGKMGGRPRKVVGNDGIE